MSVSYTACSGIDGNISIGGYDLPARHWDYRFWRETSAVPSVAGRGYCDHVPGLKFAYLRANGPAPINFDMFLDAHLYIGTSQSVILQLDILIIKPTITSVIIKEYYYTHDVDGIAQWNLECVVTGPFPDMGGNNA